MSDNGFVYDPVLPFALVGGEMIPTGKKPVTAVEIMGGLRTTLGAEYDGKDPTKMGLTKAEAINVSIINKAADGDLSAIGMVWDRTMGKPVQQVQSLTVTTSLKDFLNGLIAANARRTESPF